MNSYPTYEAMKDATAPASCYLERFTDGHGPESGGFFTWVPGDTATEIPGIIVSSTTTTGNYYRNFDGQITPEMCGAIGRDDESKPSSALGSKIYASLFGGAANFDTNHTWDHLGMNTVFRAAEADRRYRYILSPGSYRYYETIYIPRAQTNDFGPLNATNINVSGTGGTRSISIKMRGGAHNIMATGQKNGFIFDDLIIAKPGSNQSEAVYNENGHEFDGLSFGNAIGFADGGLRISIGLKHRVINCGAYALNKAGFHLHFCLNSIIEHVSCANISEVPLYVGSQYSPFSKTFLNNYPVDTMGVPRENGAQSNGTQIYNTRIRCIPGTKIPIYIRAVSDSHNNHLVIEGSSSATPYCAYFFYNTTKNVKEHTVSEVHVEEIQPTLGQVLFAGRNTAHTLRGIYSQVTSCPLMYGAQSVDGYVNMAIEDTGWHTPHKLGYEGKLPQALAYYQRKFGNMESGPLYKFDPTNPSNWDTGTQAMDTLAADGYANATGSSSLVPNASAIIQNI